MMKKMNRSINILLVFCMILPLFPAMIFAMPMEHVEVESDFDYEHFFSESSRLVSDNQCDGFFGSIVFTVGSPYMRIDGTVLELETDIAIVDEQILLPICVIDRETGGHLDLAERGRFRMDYELVGDQLMMPIEVIDT